MTSTIRITHVATGSQAVTVTVLQQQAAGLPQPVAEHTLKPGETVHATVNDGQRVVVIEPAPRFAEQLARYRAAANATISADSAARRLNAEAVLDELARIESDTRANTQE